ncbi:hypothetical protein AJ78_08191 [Emergomyces pasteurianus Ep9510]|uniref:Uncharacterized protein n=1 Tax=Emergomyces pasteurianus Ep9510 TaxID=1447872 RepID=A0A1J9P2D6_9EURO|nr:hypothetical protein AJ78_08191 [Emergomyces pasteurianus Ep9510]
MRRSPAALPQSLHVQPADIPPSSPRPYLFQQRSAQWSRSQRLLRIPLTLPPLSTQQLMRQLPAALTLFPHAQLVDIPLSSRRQSRYQQSCTQLSRSPPPLLLTLRIPTQVTVRKFKFLHIL